MYDIWIYDVGILIDTKSYRSRKEQKKNTGPKATGIHPANSLIQWQVASELGGIRPSQSKRKKKTQNVENADPPILASSFQKKEHEKDKSPVWNVMRFWLNDGVAATLKSRIFVARSRSLLRSIICRYFIIFSKMNKL